MFDTIILLAGLAEQGPLGRLLRELNPRLTIQPIGTKDDLDAIDCAVLAGARLIAFSSPIIVPRAVLRNLGYGAYNFHPGPPQYPGWAPAHFALYEQATEFGATAHLMAARVDSGPIIDVVSFAIPQGAGVIALEGLAYAHLARLFWTLAKPLATSAESLPTKPVQWSGRKNSRSAYAAICDIPLDITKDEFERRMRVFGGNHFGVTPTIHLHGIEFRAVL
jgi:methionyl-tRNA formyltransferase